MFCAKLNSVCFEEASPMNKRLLNVLSSSLVLAVLVSTSLSQSQKEREKLEQIQQELKADIPHVLCLDERITTGGQPTDSAYAKLASAGFKSVLNLRTASEGVDTERERQLAEKSGLHYISIPVTSNAPQPEQVPQFIAAVKDGQNQPMLIHCGSANRVGAFWMIYRVVEQGWPEQKALDEATQIGLTSPALKKFAADYIAAHKKSAG
jgi:uncharacterized protein (TIGR01244 family)